MSADRQRLTSAIRRIAKTDPEIRGLLDAADNKGAKPGAAGVGGGLASEEGDNIVNETRICCDGSVGDPNPGVDERDPTDGDQDGLDPNDPPNLGNLSGGCLTGVTNCATGEAVSFCGDDWIPPEGWEDGAPTAKGWFEGFYWSRSGQNALTCCEAYRKVAEASDRELCSCSVSEDGSTVTYTSSLIGGSCEEEIGAVTTDTCTKRDCSSPSTYIEEYCDLDEPPKEKFWPSDGVVNLSVKGGKIVGSKFDPENDGSYSAPMSEIHICDGANSMYLAPSGSESGGWKTINSTRTEGYLYNSKFEQIAHIDGNEYSDPNV